MTTLPRGVPSNATQSNGSSYNAEGFGVPAAGAGATLKLITTLCVTNNSGAPAYVGVWIGLDCNTSNPVEADSAPLLFQPGTTRQDIITFVQGLASGYHQVDLFLNCGASNVNHTWSRFAGEVTMA